MYLCKPEFRILIHSLCIVTWKYGFPCVTQCICSSQFISVPTPHCLECIHASVHVFMLTWLPVLAKPPMETWVPVCVTVCVSQSPCLWSHTFIRSMYIHQYMYTCPPDLQCLFHPFWIVIQKSGCPSVGRWLCLNDPTTVPISWLECAHASVHVYMSICLCMSAQPTNAEVGAPIRCGSSSLRWDLQSGGTFNWSWDLQLEVPPGIGGLTSAWSSHLWLEVPPPIRKLTSNWSSHHWLFLVTHLG